MIINVLFLLAHSVLAFCFAHLAQKHYENGLTPLAYIDLALLICNIIMAFLRFVMIVST